MRVRSLAGMQVILPPPVCTDSRGEMWPWYDSSAVPGVMHEGTAARSGEGVLRGIHYDLGRAKYVTCMHGAIYDVAVDLRRDSPTFGDWTSVVLDDGNRKAVYLPAGLGHGYVSLEESLVVYLYDTPYNPGNYHAINPLSLGIEWPWQFEGRLLMSDKDAAGSPGLDQVP